MEKRTGADERRGLGERADERRGLGEEQLTNTLGNVTYYGKVMGSNETLSSGKKCPVPMNVTKVDAFNETERLKGK